MAGIEPQGRVIPGPAILRRQRALRLAFWVYAAAVFTATHWPRLKIGGPEGSDKVIHMGVFGTWMVLATSYGWFGRPLSDRNLIRTLLVSAAYAGVDEGLQAIPFIHRTAALDDYAANAIGILLVAAGLLAFRHWSERRADADDQA